MKFEISKDEYKSGGPRRYRLELSLTGMLGLGTVFLLGLVWVFIFGVLVGRGYQPEKAVPELAKIMPDAPAKKKADAEVIQPEQLTFLNKLREEPPRRTAAGASGQAERAAPQQSAAETVARGASASSGGTETVAARETAAPPQPVPQAKPVTVAEKPRQEAPTVTPPRDPSITEVTELAEERAIAEAPAPAEKPEKSQDEEDTDQTRYNYVYQVASLSEPEAALRFRDKVRQLGLQSEVKVIRGEKKYWHRVVVLFQGRPMDTREMKAKLKTLGVDKPLLRSKDPIS